MDSPKKITAASFLMLWWMCFCVKSVPKADSETVIGCNAGLYATGDPFIQSLVYILPDLQEATSTHQGYDYRNVSPYSSAFAYGHATCNISLTRADCANCLVSALTSMLTSCSRSMGAKYQSTDCSMRYEQTAFSD